MTVYPVIMCGGSGTRLWPASRPTLPKQFLPLLGPLSSFQTTVQRVADIPGAVAPLVVAGVKHQRLIETQLQMISADGALLLEPEARDSAAAIAAAAAWIEARDPDAVAVVVSADHHVPDPDAFCRSIAATLEAAREGAIVTLGIQPTEPATAYGYIRPQAGEGGVLPVEAFVEKPDMERARAYMAEGYLWNSGYFVATARTLLGELEAFAPEIAAAARKGVAQARGDGALTLGEAFRSAPKISIDYAVMEKTSRAAVLPVDFAWSDLGAWDAVWAASPKDDHGNSVSDGAQAIGSHNILVRATEGVHVAVVGAENLAIVVEADAVLVCRMDESQAVKTVAAAAPGARSALTSLKAAADWYEHWLTTAALPLWATLGVDPRNGGFREGLTLSGGSHDPFRRVRVQARQAFVYAAAAKQGYEGPWLGVARRGLDFLLAHGRRPDGMIVSQLAGDGRVLDDTARLYEQDFAMLAMAALHELEPGSGWADQATQLRTAIGAMRHPQGGFREAGSHPFQANSTMHLLETALEWQAAGGDAEWAALADELAGLALDRFIDPETGVLQEFFDAEWRPITGEAGLVEPGHHFEWAWLLERWGVSRGDARGRSAARKLFELGKRGVDTEREVAVNALWDDLSVRDATARLWPQTEYLKAALILGEEGDALMACRGLARYLDVPTRGAWRDKMRPDGSFVDEPAPASSFYHIMVALQELFDTARRVG
ncbi:AGE family epimerase/isomerase [Phenylobacterium deserti]|uniref:Mannose-1-phosphate guanylyltransferase n=1 Tax=Phenylobacterium deserti TaxID=1914756 RepID=A0A328ADA0_9CAUL|nr:AGE family epimerase/isomerase [Phenylobacterium deserti]RAK52649.1 mannose-1-phosphate guanylyltransferase [Phenylobacterium deserti]